MQPMQIEIYSKPYCLYCNKAKALLESKGLKYLEYEIGKHIDVEALKTLYPTMRSVPIIVIDNHLIGGFAELNEELKNYESNIYLAE